MIQIVQSDDVELQLNGIDPHRSNIRRDKELYSKFIHIYETNFDIWLEKTKSKQKIEKFTKSQKDYFDDLAVRERSRLRNEFGKVRPYFYTYKGNYFFFRSTLFAFQEAVIVMLEPSDVLSMFEKNLTGLGVLEKIKRRTNNISFVTDLDR